MSRTLSLRALLRAAFFFSLAFLFSFEQVGTAADALQYYRNFFVTGDTVAGGVGLSKQGVYSPSLGNYFATGTINIGGSGPNGSEPLPAVNGRPAEVVAAFLYWQSDEPAGSNPSAMNGFFDFDQNGQPNPIEGRVLGDPNNPSCDFNSRYGRGYSADVLRFLQKDPVYHTRTGNGPHTVSLRDDGPGNPAGVHTNGATLLLIYRIVVPGQPLIEPFRSVVIYDGAFTMNQSANKLDQVIGGFYQAYQTGPQNPERSKLIMIAGNGQPGFDTTLNVNTAFKPSTFKDAFTGTAGTRWDNPTFAFNLGLNDSTYSAHVTANPNVCLTWTAMITSTKVVDTDHDGHLDIWETQGMHRNLGDATHPATFGTCADYPADLVNCVNLPAMGADPNKQDIFVEIDWMRGTEGHLHMPKLAALQAMAARFSQHQIRLHFDVGNNYQGNSFIVPAAYAQGGEVIEESSILCPNVSTSDCAYDKPYS